MKVKILKCEFEEFIGTEQEVYYQFSNGINFITSYGMVFVPKENYEVIEEIDKKMLQRAKMVRSMETIARCVNDEEIFIGLWLTLGVADEDIKEETTDEEIVEMGYCEDGTFGDLMNVFLEMMSMAYKDGGLYWDE